MKGKGVHPQSMISTKGKGAHLRCMTSTHGKCTHPWGVTGTTVEGVRPQNPCLSAMGGVAMLCRRRPLIIPTWYVGLSQSFFCASTFTPLVFVDIHLVLQRRSSVLGCKYARWGQHFNDDSALIPLPVLP